MEGVGEAEGGVTRIKQRGGVAIAFMAAALWIMLLIAAWEYLFLRRANSDSCASQLINSSHRERFFLILVSSSLSNMQ